MLNLVFELSVIIGGSVEVKNWCQAIASACTDTSQSPSLTVHSDYMIVWCGGVIFLGGGGGQPVYFKLPSSIDFVRDILMELTESLP